MSEERTPREGYAVIQQMGHVTLAGYVTETTLAGHGILSVAIPDGDRTIEKLIPPSTLYDLTWVGEEEARLVAKRHPVQVIDDWTVRQEAREQIEREERESIEKQVRRQVAIDQADGMRKERGRVLDVLSPARAVAKAVSEGCLGEEHKNDATVLVQAIDAYCEESNLRLRGEPPVRTYVDDDDYGSDLGDDDDEAGRRW